MTDKQFTIILDYDDEIGVKENHSGDVIVLNHRDLNSEQFVAQLVMFLNEQSDAIVNLINDEKYWEEKAIERITGLEKENNELKEEKELLRNKLNRIEDILPHFLSCAEISEFRGKTVKEDLALMKCWNKGGIKND